MLYRSAHSKTWDLVFADDVHLLPNSFCPVEYESSTMCEYAVVGPKKGNPQWHCAVIFVPSLAF